MTKAWGNEISWTVGNCRNDQQYASESNYTQDCCQPEGDWPVTCTDSYGDGWHGGFIEIDGERFCENFTTGKFHTIILSMKSKISKQSVILVLIGYTYNGGVAAFQNENICLDVKTVTKVFQKPMNQTLFIIFFISSQRIGVMRTLGTSGIADPNNNTATIKSIPKSVAFEKVYKNQ